MTKQAEATQGEFPATSKNDTFHRHDADATEGPARRRLDLQGLSPAEALHCLSQGVTLGGLSLRELIGRDRD